jgi:hypothetical protein
LNEVTPSSEPEPTPEPIPSPTPSPGTLTDLLGWRLIFNDDFDTARAAGQLGVNDPRYYAYWTWPDSYRKNHNNTGGGIYTAANLSVHDGYADVRLKGPTVAGGPASVVAFGPRLGSVLGQLYGRYLIDFEVPIKAEGFKIAWLLWPLSETWPRDGEIDFPEGGLTGNIDAFMHRQGATSGSDQDHFGSGVPVSPGRHVAVIEWLSTGCRFILDDRVLGTSTSRIPNTPMRWIIQSETRLDEVRPAIGSEAQIRIHQIGVWAKA